MTSCPYSFRILGDASQQRRLVDSERAFAGYAACDERAEVHKEAYLSAFTFGEDFRKLLEVTWSVRGFDGPCGAQYIWWDIDRENNLLQAREDARTLARSLEEHYALDEDDLLIFYSGSKGFHIGLPTALWTPPPSVTFNKVARWFAFEAAVRARVAVDAGVYDKVRAFRAPNSRHPKTGRHKRWLSMKELTHLSMDRLLTLAEQPYPFDVPVPRGSSSQAAADWQQAAQAVEQNALSRRQKRPAGPGTPRLNQMTMQFMLNGADQGDRHRLLFSAAANLAEFGCPHDLAHALLTEAALDSGLSPSEVRRQIDCGLEHHQTTGATHGG